MASLNAVTLDFISVVPMLFFTFEARFTKRIYETRVCLHNEKLFLRFIIVNPLKLRLNFITSQLQKQILAMKAGEERKVGKLFMILVLEKGLY